METIEQKVPETGEKSACILIVDDDQGLAGLMRKCLNESGFDAIEMGSCIEALNWLRTNAADLILLDHDLPDMTGGQMVLQLKARGISVPFIIVTGQGNDRLAVEMMKAGARDYIVKDLLLLDLLPSVVSSAIAGIRREANLSRATQQLKWELDVNKAIADISDFLITSSTSLEEIAGVVLESAKGLTASQHGFAASMDPDTKDLIVHTLTEMMDKGCRVAGANRRILFRIGDDGLYPTLWGHALNTKKGFFTDAPAEHEASRGLPDGHIELGNFLAVPAIVDDEVVGEIALANSESGYTQQHLDAVAGIAKIYALAIRRKRSEQQLRVALDQARQRSEENSALLAGSRAVLENREFENAARSIFDNCKNLLGATAGYVALLNKAGSENEVVFLDSGGIACSVDPSLPMPIRGLREQARQTGKAVYENDFANSEWMQFMPAGHVRLENCLFAPLIIDSRVVGLLGLANKPGGFDENDARMASAFGEIAAVALHNSRTLESLESSEQKFRSVTQTANDAVISIDSRGNIILFNGGAEKIFHYSPDELIGKSVTILMPEKYRAAHVEGLKRVVAAGGPAMIGKTVEMEGLAKDGTQFPIELSLAAWRSGDEQFFTAIIRDVTERKIAEQKILKLNEELERRVARRTAELTIANKHLLLQIEERKRLERELLDIIERERCRIGQELHDSIGQQLTGIQCMSKVLERKLSDKTLPEANYARDIASYVSQAMDQTRALAKGLHAVDLDASSLKSALEDLAAMTRNLFGIRCSFDCDHPVETREAVVAVHVYRIAQEAVTNAIKHGKAKNAKISLASHGDKTILTVENDGQDFPDTRPQSKGMGLQVMEYRAEMINGSLDVRRAEKGGTVVTCVFPNNNRMIGDYYGAEKNANRNRH